MNVTSPPNISAELSCQLSARTPLLQGVLKDLTLGSKLLIPGLQIAGEPRAAVLGSTGRPVKRRLESKPFQWLPGHLGSSPPWVVAGIRQGRRVKAQPKMRAWEEPQGPSSTVSEGSKLHPLAASKREELAQSVRLSLLPACPPAPFESSEAHMQPPQQEGNQIKTY